jgi:hypothetical protein
MSSITSSLNELKDINSELKRLRIQVRKLNIRREIVEKEIKDFLDSKDQPGIKYQGMAIIPEEKETYKAKGKKQKEEDIKTLFRNYGVDDENEAFRDLMKTMKGSPTQKFKLKIKPIK